MSLLKKEYPENWRINDWENPWLPAPVRLLNSIPDSLAKKIFPFDEAEFMARARKTTQLSDFGDPDFLEPFHILLNDINTMDHFTVMGRLTARTIIHEQLCARLCLENRIKTSPELLQQPVDRPVIIAGLPRTGTTHLHNLLSEVSSLRYMPLWQTLHPAAPPPGVKDRRREVGHLSAVAARYVSPLFPRMHEMETDLPHEELTVCALCYRSFFFEGAFQVPNYRAWYANHTHEKGYAYLKQTLKILQTENAIGDKTPNARWILKSPQHVDQLETILKIFPDAKLVLTHRDPLRAVLSMITMILYTSRHMYKPLRLKEEAHAWVDRLEQMLRRSREQAARIPASSILNVNFDAFMANPDQTIREVCEFAEVEIDSASQQAITAHLQSHTRDRHGRIDYRFEDLGLNEGELRERFSFYQV